MSQNDFINQNDDDCCGDGGYSIVPDPIAAAGLRNKKERDYGVFISTLRQLNEFCWERLQDKDQGLFTLHLRDEEKELEIRIQIVRPSAFNERFEISVLRQRARQWKGFLFKEEIRAERPPAYHKVGLDERCGYFRTWYMNWDEIVAIVFNRKKLRDQLKEIISLRNQKEQRASIFEAVANTRRVPFPEDEGKWITEP